MSARLIPFLVALAIFAADRVTKMWIESSIGVWEVRPVIPGFFNLIFTENRGMAFSILADASPLVRTVFLLGVSGAVLVFVAYMLWFTASRLQRIALTLVLGGALGNLYDRLLRGSVIDFLDLHIGEYHWPTFNLADCAITTGAIVLAWELLVAGKRASQGSAGRTVA